jgi:hypothetical protein
LVLGVVLAFASAAFIDTGNHQVSRFSEYSNRPFAQPITATPQSVQDHSEIGSTDGLTLMSFVIAGIILIPILLKRRNWSQV